MMIQTFAYTVLAFLTIVTADDNCQTIVEIASASADFSTLVAAVGAAGLVEALEGDGPFTVFAPTNKAFEKLPDGTLDDLLKPEGKSSLTDILLYHVLDKKFLSKNFVNNRRYTTLSGKSVRIRTSPVKVNNINVVTADIMACNGVIHVIGDVLIPPAAAPAPVDTRPMVKKGLKCSDKKPCSICQGSCVDDNDCRGALVCMKRSASAGVPGCRGGKQDSTGTDYCIRK